MPEVSADNLEFTYELLDEASWDDGSPLTADDVLFTLKVVKCPLTDNPAQKTLYENVKTFIPDASDPKKFKLVMKKKYIQSVAFLTDMPILSKKFFDPDHKLDDFTLEQMDATGFMADQQPALKEWATNYNDGKYGNDLNFFYGAGAYKIVDWDRGHTITLQRKENHWTQHLKQENIYLNSYPEKIIYKVVQDENAMGLECKSQSIDATTWLSTRTLIDLQQDSTFNLNYHSAFLEHYNYNFIALNMRPDGVKHKKIFDDVRVRKAMAFLTPVDKIIEIVTFGKSTRWPSIIPPMKKEYDSTLQLIPYDVAAAGKLLDEAGWKDTDGDNIRDKMVNGEKVKLEVELLYGAQGNLYKDITTMMAEGAYAAGVKINPLSVEGGVLRQRAASHDFDMVMSAWALSSAPEDFSQLWSTEAWVTKGNNFAGFGNAASDALIDSINVTLNDSLRLPMVRQLEKMIYDSMPYVFLYSPYRKIIIHQRWGNAIMTSEFPNLIAENLKLISGGASAQPADVQVKNAVKFFSRHF